MLESGFKEVIKFNPEAYWDVVVKQNAYEIKNYFKEEAIICWHNTNEKFSVDEFIKANCDYPGTWGCNVERIEKFDSLYITVVHVFDLAETISFHTISFIKVFEEKIASIDEYWSEDGEIPGWRVEKGIGSKIK